MLGADFALCQTLVFAGDLRGAAELLEGDREHLMRTARHAYVGTTGTPSVLFLSGLAMTQAMIGEAGRLAGRRTRHGRSRKRRRGCTISVTRLWRGRWAS